MAGNGLRGEAQAFLRDILANLECLGGEDGAAAWDTMRALHQRVSGGLLKQVDAMKLEPIAKSLLARTVMHLHSHPTSEVGGTL